MFGTILYIDSRDPFHSVNLDGGTTFSQSLLSFFKRRTHSMDGLFLCDAITDSEKIFRSISQFPIPSESEDRFMNHVKSMKYRTQSFKSVDYAYDLIIIKHVRNAFGIEWLKRKFSKTPLVIFPMLLGLGYRASGYNVPDEYMDLERQTLSQANFIITPSLSEARQLTGQYGVAEESILIVPRWYKEDIFGWCSRTLDGILEVACIGAVKPQKSIIELLDIASYTSKLHLNIIGVNERSGIQDYNVYTKLVLEKAQKLKNVTLHSFVGQNDLFATISKMHVVVSISRWETFGKAVVEAMATGMPALLPNDIECFREMFHDNKGVIFCERNPKYFAQILVDLHCNKKQYYDLAIAAHESAKRYAEHIVVPEFEKAILQIQKAAI